MTPNDLADRAASIWRLFRQPDSNVIEVNDQIKALVPIFQKQLPPSVHLGIRGDRSAVIRDAFRDIRFTMILAGAGDRRDLFVPAHKCFRDVDSQYGAAVLLLAGTLP